MGASEMEQLLINLLQNSVDATNSDGHITIESRVHERELRVTITDTGCGIPYEVLNRIFDPFFTTKTVGYGTGLGLSVCHDIVRRAGGSIEVQSAPGQGTRVTIALPLRGIAPQEPRSIKACPLGEERNRPAKSQTEGETP